MTPLKMALTSPVAVARPKDASAPLPSTENQDDDIDDGEDDHMSVSWYLLFMILTGPFLQRQRRIFACAPADSS
jgi:hypothetical protein